MEPRTLTTRKGKTVVTTLSDDDAHTELRKQLRFGGSLCGNDFARTLASRESNQLSQDQAIWVHILVVGDQDRTQQDLIPGLVLEPIVLMMNKAAAAQKRWPKIVLEGMTLMRKPSGVIVIQDGDKTKLGDIDKRGCVTRTKLLTDEHIITLRRLAASPELVASQHGIATGNCCFCARLLSTIESRSVGYGPVCAAKFDLPWGEISKEANAIRMATEIKQLENETEVSG